MKGSTIAIIIVCVIFLIIVLNVHALFFGLLYISFNSIFFLDNLFNLVNSINPLICWGFVSLLLGSLIGFLVSVRKFKLDQKFYTYGSIGILFFLFLITLASKPFDYKTSKFFHDDHAWSVSKQTNTFASYERYLKEFPSGKYVPDALICKETRFWDSAVSSGDPALFHNYSELFPSGVHKSNAENLYEESLWKRAKSSSNIDRVNDYIQAFPNGKYLASAKSRLWKLKQKNNNQQTVNEPSTSSSSGTPASNNEKVDNTSTSQSPSSVQNTTSSPTEQKTGESGSNENVKNGYGSYTYTDGRVYRGNFKNGKFHGSGTLYFTDGSKLVGKWVKGVRDGKFTLYNTDNTTEIQTFKSGSRIK